MNKLQTAVPGEARSHAVAEAGSSGLKAAFVSELDGHYYITYMELPPEGEENDRRWLSRQASYVPPAGSGVIVRYQSSTQNPFDAGMEFAQFFYTLMGEASGKEVFSQRAIEEKIISKEKSDLFEKLLDYEKRSRTDREGEFWEKLRQQLQTEVEQGVEDDEEREALYSLHQFVKEYESRD